MTALTYLLLMPIFLSNVIWSQYKNYFGLTDGSVGKLR